MAQILSKDLTVTNGQVIFVQNTNKRKFSNQNDRYCALWVQMGDDCEKCLLFTEKEFTKLILNTVKTNIDELVLGKAYTFNEDYLIKIKNIDSIQNIIYLKKYIYERALRRANKNIEDQPEKSWYVDYIMQEI